MTREKIFVRQSKANFGNLFIEAYFLVIIHLACLAAFNNVFSTFFVYIKDRKTS